MYASSTTTIPLKLGLVAIRRTIGRGMRVPVGLPGEQRKRSLALGLSMKACSSCGVEGTRKYKV